MPRVTDTRARMVTAAARLFRRQGYAATGWRQVVAEGGTPWGSQAHHFPGGKEQLAAEAIEHGGRSYERLLRAALAQGHPAEAVSLWAEAAAAQLAASGWADGCPVATVALEAAHTSDRLAAACRGAFGGWRAALAEAMATRGVPAGEAAELATFVLATIEGALLLSRADRDGEPLRVAGRQLARVLAERVP